MKHKAKRLEDVRLLFVTEYQYKGNVGLGPVSPYVEAPLEVTECIHGKWDSYFLSEQILLSTEVGYEKKLASVIQKAHTYIEKLPNLQVVVTFGDRVSSLFTGRHDNAEGSVTIKNGVVILTLGSVEAMGANSEKIPVIVKSVLKASRLATDPFAGIPIAMADAEYLEQAKAEIVTSGVLAYDTETSSLDPYSHDTYVIGVSLSWADDKACFIPLEHDELNLQQEELLARVRLIKEILGDSRVRKVAQNGKFDRQILHQCLGVTVQGDYADTMLDHHILDETSSHSLSSMVEEYLPDYIGYDSLMNLHMYTEEDMTIVPLESIVKYACGDAFLTYKLHFILEELLMSRGQLELAREIALPANLVYTKMEEAGVALDIPLMNSYIPAYGNRVTDLQRRLHTLPVVVAWYEKKMSSSDYSALKASLDCAKTTGKLLDGKNATPRRIASLEKKLTAFEESAHFNPASAPQTIEMFYDFCGLPVQTKYTKTKNGKEERVSAGKEARIALLGLTRTGRNKDALDLVEFMTEYSKINKLYTGFVRDYDKHIRDDGLVHTSFNQAVTRTGRLSNSNPNLQNVPKLTKAGEDEPEYTQWTAKHSLKRGFISKFKDGLIINVDFSQLELRIMASLSGDQRMLDAYNVGGDLHAQTARLMFPDYDTVSDELRKHYRDLGKTKNFASVYALLPDFLELYPGLGEWVESIKEFIKDNKFSYNPFNRQRHLDDLYKDYRGKMRQGVNAVIQSTGHDMLMRALIKVDKAFTDHNLKSHIIFEVHDSIVVDCYAPEKETVARLMKEIMEDTSDLPWVRVPILVDVEGGDSWGTVEPILVA